MKVIETGLPGVLIIEPKIFGDERGFFTETWNKHLYTEAGITADFVQDNLSMSRRGVLRGLHFQNPNAQGKLVTVLQGEVYDVAVDIRRGSPTFGQWASVSLSSKNRRLIYIPEGFSHGFCVTSETALFSYKCTDRYNPGAEGSILWNDPGLAIDWPIESPELSAKDRNGIRLKDFLVERLPAYHTVK
ncbi:MAG: dTDP-4-dehydrorhamnose 3,5-epimerase [endosymbiont of Seepiophila jonesi]|uniref:dTDP-4-dehydrorhamnose 3,5-epimerase n=1 Tax=endosymbiont of Lamellibrachia luymesi TaxID=2200907 RepID=A0A370DZ35_9GAMM|nr:MAG: dTDP-4-dehydrorhamnose 3,5-epimerase [endosymbiont of Lamellibrachia luymesi]RDH91849.1 MAG: dTDP-4-dehydrorhamnose 3,5-epimerase [endosymbiont of Seepiophila jonesi]